MINTRLEDLLTLQQATREKLLGKPPHISTIWRWSTRGIRGVKLETIRIAGRRYTSLEAIERFISATSGVRLAQSNHSVEDELDRELGTASPKERGLS